MIKVLNVSLENEMDLVLAHKRSMKVAEKLGLTLATQTTFATAVSEIARTVIEHTDNGQLYINLSQQKQRYNLVASVEFDSDIHFTNEDSGYYYAQKLVPEFNLIQSEKVNTIEMKIGLPRSLRLDPIKIAALKKYFEDEEPINAYDEIKQRNTTLNKIAREREEALQRSKIIDEQKTEFISIASHEIKTPITIIKAYTQIAQSLNDQCSEQVSELLSKVDFQTTKLLSLIHQLLDISKIEQGNLQYLQEQVQLNDFIMDMVSIISNIIPDHKIITTLGEDVPVVIDKIRMEQVFSNLLVNAAKYSPANTTINLNTDLDGNGFIKMSVADEGRGMSATTMQSIFNKFYRNEDVIATHSGLGMGLYIASKIISDHGGKIWVDSKEGVGSTFFFTIPTAHP